MLLLDDEALAPLLQRLLPHHGHLLAQLREVPRRPQDDQEWQV